MSDGLEGLDHGGDFDEARHVAAWTDRKDDVGNFHPEDLVEIGFEAGAFLIDAWLPLLESDDEVDVLFEANGADTKELGDIDDTDTAALHVAAVEVAADGRDAGPHVLGGGARLGLHGTAIGTHRARIGEERQPDEAVFESEPLTDIKGSDVVAGTGTKVPEEKSVWAKVKGWFS